MASKKPGVDGDLYKDNAVLFIDTTLFSNTTKSIINKYEDNFMLVMVGNCVFSITFNYGYLSDTNAGSERLLTENKNNDNSAITELITGFDVVANGYVITRRRYGNPGVKKSSAYNDARAILKYIYDGIKATLDADTSDKDYKLTTLCSYPKRYETKTVSELKSKGYPYNGSNYLNRDGGVNHYE